MMHLFNSGMQRRGGLHSSAQLCNYDAELYVRLRATRGAIVDAFIFFVSLRGRRSGKQLKLHFRFHLFHSLNT